MNYSSNTVVRTILDEAIQDINELKDKPLDVLDITKPPDLQYARNLAQVVHKLSPLIGNMIEFSLASYLNDKTWPVPGAWIRQDPDFPDVYFSSDLSPSPGIEIKTWFPLATEITARFKESVTMFEQDHTYVAVVVWVPEYVIYGKPKIVDVWCDTARSLAVARDSHYHNPPDYIVLEPFDTSSRTRNLQQRNVNGHKFQGTPAEFQAAQKIVESWGPGGKIYNPSPEYQLKLRSLMGQFEYRLDTNFAKIDRIRHDSLEKFKTQVLTTQFMGKRFMDWIVQLNIRNTDLDNTLQALL